MALEKITLDEIHDSLINGQRRQMVKFINKYGVDEFWKDYKNFLDERYEKDEAFEYFSQTAVFYFKILITG
jgi:predicted Rossmann-fold nucleotide-binding protein